ncbi:MAG: sensor histidine kinase [Bacteroidota bacterium]
MFELLAGLELGSFLFAITCILLIMVFAFMVIFFVTYNRNMSIQRSMKKMSDEHQQHIIASNLITLETERQRFAEDLHDEIGASLSAIRLYVGSIDNQLQDKSIKEQLKEVKNTIDQSMASTRRIAHNILPPGLEIMGLSKVASDLVKQLNAANTLNVIINTTPDMPKLDYHRELILYRVLQELFNNTLKHAEASRVTISFEVTQGRYALTFEDDGRGFDQNGQQFSGIGLSNLTNRIKMIGGACMVETAPGQGFKTMISVPVSGD